MAVPIFRLEVDFASSRLGLKPIDTPGFISSVPTTPTFVPICTALTDDDDDLNARVLSLLTVNMHMAHPVVQRFECATAEEDAIDAEVFPIKTTSVGIWCSDST
jgi:hypothetical protein